MHTSHELYHLVAPLAGLGIWEHNLATGEFYINYIAQQVLGVDGLQPAPEIFLTLFDEANYISELSAEVLATGEACTITTQMHSALGTAKWVKLRIAVKKEHDAPSLLYGTIEDVTEEVIMQRRMEEREQRFSLAFTNAPIGMALVALNGNWIKVNTSLCELMGYPEDEFLQHTFQDFTFPEDLDTDLAYVEQLVTGKIRFYSLEKRYLHKNGHIIWALLNVSLIRDNQGRPLYFVSHIKDITQRKKNTEIIQSQNERLLSFAHIVSHNLRSHTGNIKALTELVLREKQPEEADQLVHLLADSAERLLETINDLNDIVVIQGQRSLNKETLGLHQTVERVRSILYALLEKERAMLINHIPKDVSICFNPAYLESIFVNLTSNALRYRHAERLPVIHIDCYETADSIVVKVKDNGRGLDMALHGSKVFGMYKTFHGHPEAKGLGLFLVRTQAEAMNSTVSLESVVNEGSVFTIEIPKNNT